MRSEIFLSKTETFTYPALYLPCFSLNWLNTGLNGASKKAIVISDRIVHDRYYIMYAPVSHHNHVTKVHHLSRLRMLAGFKLCRKYTLFASYRVQHSRCLIWRGCHYYFINAAKVKSKIKYYLNMIESLNFLVKHYMEHYHCFHSIKVLKFTNAFRWLIFRAANKHFSKKCK